MRLVIDTNVLLTSIGSKSNRRWLFDALLTGKVAMVVTNEIISEYVEIIAQKADAMVAENVVSALLNLRRTEQIKVYFHWNLIAVDPDDNKFADCAVCANADFLVTGDGHFDVLKKIDFPKIEVISAKALKDVLLGLQQ